MYKIKNHPLLSIAIPLNLGIRLPISSSAMTAGTVTFSSMRITILSLNFLLGIVSCIISIPPAWLIRKPVIEVMKARLERAKMLREYHGTIFPYSEFKPPEELFDEKKPNISSHAVGLRSQTDDNFTSYFGEVPPILDYFDCQTYPKNSQESSILSSHRQFNEHYQSHHHNNQLPTDQFVMNRPDVSPTSRHVFVDASTNGLNYVIDYSRCIVPRLHQSSYHSGREVVEQEHRQSRIDYPQPQVIRPAPYTLYDPRYADIGLPVDPYLRAMKLNPHFSMQKATSEESSTTKRKRTDYACNSVPRLHQSSSHSGREVVEPEHRQSRIDYPQAISPPFEPYDPRYAAMGLPMDPYLRAFKLNPNLGLAKPNE